MDFLKKMTDGSGGGDNNQSGGNNQNNQGGNNGNSDDIGSKLMGSFNNMAGGGEKGEQNEDGLDKGTDLCSSLTIRLRHCQNELARRLLITTASI